MGKNKSSKKGKPAAHKAGGAPTQGQKAPRRAEKAPKQAPPPPRPAAAPASAGGSKLSALQLQFKKKLEGARFRTINEQLYTCRGDDAFEKFQLEPELFDVYHEGYREQAKGWTVNPLHNIISWIKGKHRSAVVVDMGCGDAQLAQSIPNTVHSFDLVSRSPLVTACNMAHLPLEDESVDIVVFCLSLMGTNIGDFLKEAHRVLKNKGIVKVAEVRSRFEGEEEGLKKFIRVIKLSGFEIVQKDFLSKMFLMLECHKSKNKDPLFNDSYSAKPCVYKKR